MKRFWLAAALVILAAMLWCLARAGRPPPLPRPELCLTVLDVGQGDAQLLSFPGQRYWLIDGGGVSGGGYDVGARRLLPMLRKLGVEHLDKLFVTHAHADHFEGLFAVLEAITADELWLPSRDGLDPRARALVRSARRRGLVIHEVGRGALLPAESAPVDTQLLYPWPGWQQALGKKNSTVNNSSLVLRIALGKVSFLLTGDIEAEAEHLLLAQGAALRSTVIKVPHHASRSSSTASFVEAVDPLVAVAGIGKDNRFGFPHASVSARYLGRGTPLVWTGRHGHLRLCTTGYSLRVEQLNERGSPSLVREWDVQDISRWHAESVLQVTGRERVSGVAAARPAQVSTPRTRRSRFAKSAKKRRKADKARVAPGPDQGQADEVKLIDEREWKRRRKARRKLKAPWR